MEFDERIGDINTSNSENIHTVAISIYARLDVGFPFGTGYPDRLVWRPVLGKRQFSATHESITLDADDRIRVRAPGSLFLREKCRQESIPG